VFDGAISISAVQWLCNADRTSHDPRRRLKRFFETLYSCLARGARAVLQVGLGLLLGGRLGGWLCCWRCGRCSIDVSAAPTTT
jgi:hypothetical protein